MSKASAAIRRLVSVSTRKTMFERDGTYYQVLFYVCFFFFFISPRSGVRLRSLGSGHTHLKLVISDQSSTRQRYKDLLTTQTSASHRLDRWSQAEDSPAIQDILHQTHELNVMWIDAQREFVGKSGLWEEVWLESVLL